MSLDPDEELLTTAEAARLLGVGPTSVKRWADAGLLRCAKTAGKHRRFTRTEIERWRDQGGEETPSVSSPLLEHERAQAWTDLLLQRPDALALQGELLRDRSRLGAWWRVAELIGAALVELGTRWTQGRVSILQEHAASEALARGVARIVESLPEAHDSPRALLIAAEEDDHTLGLSLVELTLREAGWSTRWAGRRTPTAVALSPILVPEVELVAVSASSASVDASALDVQARTLGAACKAMGVALLLGGEGPWPEPLLYGHRVRSFSALRALLDGPLSPVPRAVPPR